jgi:hypothetical protein
MGDPKGKVLASEKDQPVFSRSFRRLTTILVFRVLLNPPFEGFLRINAKILRGEGHAGGEDWGHSPLLLFAGALKEATHDDVGLGLLALPGLLQLVADLTPPNSPSVFIATHSPDKTVRSNRAPAS